MTATITAVEDWLQRAVVGLGLCPFAAQPLLQRRVRIHVSLADTVEALLGDLHEECVRLDETPAEALETTLIVIPSMLADFDDYNDFLDPAEALLRHFGWEGIYQIASFHPDYRFAGVPAHDPGNLTNRAPYPLLHLLREASVETAIATHPDAESIPERNVARLQAMSAEARQAVFGFQAS